MSVSDPRIGLDFGDYKVTRRIAEGGMGAVYLAEHSSGMRKCVKFMLGEALRVPAIRKRFETECIAAKRFKGRAGIVTIDSFGERNGELYLVMEYLDGITLEDHIRKNVRLTEHHTFHVIVLCLRALATLHTEGIIHRDFKPGNVFLRDTDERRWDPVLIDFGIVHDNRGDAGEFRTKEGALVGTPGFMAIEQFGRADKVTPATDVFACAVLAWLMLTGELPWGYPENEYAQYERQLRERPVWPEKIPLQYAPGWKDILINALSPDPKDRPASAQLFALLLAQALAPTPPHVPSGLEMLAKLAPRFLQNLPAELETVRQSGARIEVAAFWPPLVDSHALITPSSSGANLDAIRVSAVMPTVPAPESAATVNARPPVETPAMPTTLSRAINASTSPERTSSHGRFALLAVGGFAVALLVGVGVFFGVKRLAPSRSTSAESRPSPTSSNDVIVDASAPVPDAVVAPPPVVVKASDPPAASTQPAMPSTAAPTSKQAVKRSRTRSKATQAPAEKPAETPHASIGGPPPQSGGAANRGSNFDPDAVKE
ncbi:MAG: protein kinase [Kofleriaceae bacterium]